MVLSCVALNVPLESIEYIRLKQKQNFSYFLLPTNQVFKEIYWNSFIVWEISFNIYCEEIEYLSLGFVLRRKRRSCNFLVSSILLLDNLLLHILVHLCHWWKLSIKIVVNDKHSLIYWIESKDILLESPGKTKDIAVVAND